MFKEVIINAKKPFLAFVAIIICPFSWGQTGKFEK
jgi:hypothetical protein